MKNRLFLLLFIFPSTFFALKAQDHVIDSMRQVLKNEKKDTNKVNTLNTLSEELWRISKFDSATHYANNALTLATQLDFDNGRGNALSTLGVCHFYKGNYPASLNNAFDGLKVFQGTGNKKGITTCLRNIGRVYNMLGNYPKSLEYFFKALALCREIGEKKESAAVLNNIGIIYYYQHNYSKALEYYFQALDISLKIGDKANETSDLCNIGLVYADQGKYDMALEYDFKSLNIDRQTGNKQSEANNLGNIGDVYSSLGKYDTALEYLFRAEAISREIGYTSQFANNMNDIGYIYIRQRKYVPAELYLDSAMLVSRKMAEKEIIKNVFANRAKLDSAKRDYKAELEDNKNYDIYRDSLNSEKTVQEEMNYESDRKADSVKAEQDKTLAIASKESQRQKVIRNSFIGGFSITLIAAGLFFFQRRRIAREKRRSDELLLNILPEETAEELKESGVAKAKSFALVTVMFTDFKNFTKISERLSPAELVAELHYLFQEFDTIIQNHNLEKIKTIGDSYMAAGGIPVANQTHAKDAIKAALEIQQFLGKHNQRRILENKPLFEARIGINTGPVVAGIVGIKKFAYDIWGDTVNIASRMESTGEAGKINISGNTYDSVKDIFVCTYRGKIEAKNKGVVDMYFVDNVITS